MKYNLKIISVLVAFFLISQVTGLFFINGSISSVVVEDGGIVIEHKKAPVERPQTTGAGSFVFLLIGIGVATALLLLLIRFHLFRLWKLWFFLAVWVTVTVALAVYLNSYLAAFLAFILGLVKILKPNPILHNVTEILIYSGIAVLFVPIFELFWIFALLIAISVYDMIAVWKTKHMVKMALFLNKSRLFAGLSFPLGKISKGKKAKEGIQKTDAAILGGGDIAFPLLFTGVVMEELVRGGLNKLAALEFSFIVTAAVTAALLMLFLVAKKGRFYPAMPFLTAGCVAGYLIVLGVLGI
jgi:presenilin-like A22 family membrane protease